MTTNLSKAIRFYCGINERTWNHHPVAPGAYACIAPVYGRTSRTKTVNVVCVPADTEVIQDSGAFSDGPGQRLPVEAALERQIAHAQTFGYGAHVTHRASYDLLIDEKWIGERRHKARWSEADAALAVEETVRAAAYLAHHRHGMRAILSAQGVSPQQYLGCVEDIVPLLEEGDMLGLGGWCILGKFPSLMAVFCETMRRVFPFLARERVTWIHSWGVCYAPALQVLAWLCSEYGIRLSTDSAHPSLHPVFGEWGYANWRDPSYTRPPILDSCKAQEFHKCMGCRGLERARHVAATRHWLQHFPLTPPPRLTQPRQLSLMEVSL
jgi:hypothetical protein